MADFAQHLPLSQRAGVDESNVSSDRRAAVADVVVEAARILGIATHDDAAHQARARRFLDEAGLGTGATGGSATDLRHLAETLRTGRRRRIGMLVNAVRALLVLADTVGVAPHLDPAVSGAVALAAEGKAAFARRAVLRGHTVRATDEGWGFGYGPVLQGTGRSILRFILELEDTPPQPLNSPR
ncbi:hypothetical protein LQ938_10780 [Microbacterium sp. cx-55]|uniref:hypothetical protein n=1 Tax=Microbacterium sp. cx-55 TaxID=2875948 RepID=UPI001CBD6E86|nr:hypothetical protein [Microbacterium sp. cx-55]MBZ4485754.1 hypothetical protein [Microbacterium sp. cx-55]UGB34360.1 hypothetical protein LQ938_10780 [Microbacterium sp. cx-55]